MKCNRNGTKIVFTFDGLDAVEFDRERVNPVLNIEAEMHGYEQKIRDNAAISRKQKDGSVITVTEQMRRDAVMEMVNHLHTSATWNMRTAATPKLNPVFLDIAAKRGCTYQEAETWYANKMVAEMQKLIDAEQSGE